MNPGKELLRGAIQTGDAIHQDHVAADAERWRLASKLDGLVCGRRRGHERGAGQAASGRKLNNGAIDARREAEIVGVDDELFHALECIRRASFGLYPAGCILPFGYR